MILRFKAFLILSILVVLSSCHISKSAVSNEIKADGLELRVMSFNIRYGSADDGENRWEKRMEMVFDLLRSHHSDVVGLQEALRFQIDEIRKAVPLYGERKSTRLNSSHG